MKKFGMWGPSIPVDTNKGVQGESRQGATPDRVTMLNNSERIGYSKQLPDNEIELKERNILPPTIKISYGIGHVLLGFFLLIVMSFVTAIGFVFWELRGNLTDAANDPELITQALEKVTTNPALVAVSALTMYLAWMIAVKVAANRAFKSIRRTFRIYFKKRDWLIGLGLAVVMRIVEGIAQMPFADVFENEASNATNAVSYTGIWYVINAILIAAILAPLFEEIFFRGLFLSAMQRKFVNWRKRRHGKVDWVYKSRYVVSILVTSVVFGFMHYPGGSFALNTITIVETGLIGALLAWMTIRTKRLGPAITTHMFFNLTGVILATMALGS